MATLDSTAEPDRRRTWLIEPRTIAPALVVLALALVMSVVLPSLDSQTSYSQQTHTGDVAEIATGLTLAPKAGWNLASGALAGKARSAVGPTASTELDKGNVELFIQAAPFAGTPLQLLARINKIDDDLHRARGRAAGNTGTYTVETEQGVVGVAENFVGVARQGSIIAFVFPAHGQSAREGVEIVAAGPPEEISRRRDAIVAMIRSLRSAS
jgi:hypothetical protein